MSYPPPVGNNVELDFLELVDAPVGNNVVLNFNYFGIYGHFNNFIGTLNAGASITASFRNFGEDLNISGDISLWDADLDGTVWPIQHGDIAGSLETWTNYILSQDFELNDQGLYKYRQRSTNYWFSVPALVTTSSIVGIFSNWNADLEAHSAVAQSDLTAAFEYWTAAYYAGARIQEDLQLWNGALGSNMSSISGNIGLFTGSINGVYAFNSILTSLPLWDKIGDTNYRCGGNIRSSLPLISFADIDCTIGQVVGINTVMAKFDGVMYCGGKFVSPYPDISLFTANIVGHVTSVNRVTAVFPLLSADIQGHIQGSGKIVDTFMIFNASILGKIANPVTIKDSFIPFTGRYRGSVERKTHIQGNLLKLNGTLNARNSSPGVIIGATELLTGHLDTNLVCTMESSTGSLVYDGASL
jgi:hypothetical protein